MSECTVISMSGVVAPPEKGPGPPSSAGSPSPPRDFLLFSFFNLLLLGNPCCLSFAALVYSVKARDRKVMGDALGAQSYGSTAKWLNIWALLLNLLLLIVVLVLFFVVILPKVNANFHH
ncbi:interferon-induced transmembrane protein 3-like [Tachyglossus aculeatus]|uniref:interferon-induced transmembrane protein 3-like n=1 Tax=Tachyglossus aculeatus TaxID=9261 RepID=UPI0018F58F29|nr:interferon-induced transmembrane protein 3-like [Tachyglossus aculeatus]